MKNKVLFILSLPPPFGGGEIVSKFLYDRIRKDYNCVTFSKKKYDKAKQGNLNFYTYFYSFQYIFTIIFNIIRFRPSSIYIGLPKSFQAFFRNAIIVWFSYLFGIKVFSEIHGMSFPFAEKSGFQKKILLSTLNKLSGIRVLSNSIEEYLIELGYKRKVYVISNGVEIPDINIHKKKEFTDSKLNILYFGAISSQKGFYRVLEILTSLGQETRDKIQLNIIGEWVHKKEKEQFLKYISENKLSSCIQFLGRRVGNEKWELISENHIMIHLTEFDGQPLTIIETMSIGIPTIATKVGAIPEMISDKKNGFLINKNEDVNEILLKLLNKQISLNDLSMSAIETYKKRYTPELMVQKIKELVKE